VTALVFATMSLVHLQDQSCFIPTTVWGRTKCEIEMKGTFWSNKTAC